MNLDSPQWDAFTQALFSDIHNIGLMLIGGLAGLAFITVIKEWKW